MKKNPPLLYDPNGAITPFQIRRIRQLCGFKEEEKNKVGLDCELRKRIDKVNYELQKQGYNWEKIALFWEEVIEETKNKNGTY